MPRSPMTLPFDPSFGRVVVLSLVLLMFAAPAHAGLWQAASDSGSRADAAQGVVVPIERIADGLATDLALNALGTGLDLVSTDFALNRGCVEGNPLAPRVEGRVALKMGGAALRGTVAYWLRRKGHKTAADIFRYAGLATDLLITGSNVNCGLRGRP